MESTEATSKPAASAHDDNNNDNAAASAVAPVLESTTRRPKLLTIGVIAATALLATGAAATAWALFTSQATVSGQTVSAGTLSISAETASTSSPISATGMLPGDSTSTKITLENTGNSGLYYSVQLPLDSSSTLALADAIQATVTVGSVTETRSLSAWQTGSLHLGTALAAGASSGVTVTILLPNTADNSLQGTGAAFNVQVDAVQERNVTPPDSGWSAS